MAIKTLKKRSEFLRIRGGGRCATASFVLETKPRCQPDADGARFGFTVTKKLGGAVVRNRIRRRLRAAVASLADCANTGSDYVIIARLPALERPFDALKKDLELALQRVHHAAGSGKTSR